MALTGKNAVVTGGASGIGRGICLRLARDGADVAILDLDGAGAQQVAQEMSALGRRAIAIETDVASAASVEAAMQQVHQRLGQVHILVNDAGICTFVPLMQMSEEQWDRMMAVHLKGAFLCSKAVVPDMLAAAWGRIVNLSSVAGLNGGGPGLAHYAAAKGGIAGFTKALAQELGPSGVTVNAIAPGLIDTPMVRASGIPDEVFRQALRRTPLGRVGHADDIAAACAYLVSEEASFLTGQVISPNGGTYT
jgi:2-hydroxycyclohexanecarboxyl-CoA dehydrogenase